MILKGSQRAGGNQLAAHLLRMDENEHVEIHELRGFMADDLCGAFQEIHAASKGTKAEQYLFSLSLNPPQDEQVPIEAFEAAIEHVEQRLGLNDQPRAIIFHEKEGRRHAHAVWSRIDTEEMKAINLPHYKLKLKDVAKEIYLEHGWQMPHGFHDKNERNPLNFSREEWQQARRNGQDPKDLKRTFQECWAISDSRKAFTQALWSKGFALARGDRRGYVAVDFQGEVYAIARYTGIRNKQVGEKLGDPKELPSIDQARVNIATQMSSTLQSHLEQARNEYKQHREKLALERKALAEKQQIERQHLKQAQEARWNAENLARSERLAKGLRGVWHRLTGKYDRVKRQNEVETLLAYQRDRKEKDEMIFKQIIERQKFLKQMHEQSRQHAQEIKHLREDVSHYSTMKSGKTPDLKAELESMKKERGRSVNPSHAREQDNNPELEM